MDRFQNDFSSIILNEIALEGLDGITVEALCKRLSNHPNWPLKPVDDSIKKIVWSFVVCLKNVEFYKLKCPRDPLVIFNRFEYIHNEFGSLYEPSSIPQDIYPNHPVEDGKIMGSCKEYYTRLNLGSFPRKISVEEAEKRWGRSLVIVASQEVRTKALIPDDKQCMLNLSIRYYLILERIGRSRYLGEASFGANSLRMICPDPKSLSYIRNRLTDDGLLQNQALAFSGSFNTLVANRIVISSLTKFFVKRESLIDQMVSRIIGFLKSQPNFTATYERVKSECNISFAKTFKQPLLKKYCDTNLMLKYRVLHPNASISEYSYKKNKPNKEKVLRCIRLKQNDGEEKPEIESNKKTEIEGREFKLDSTFERQILRWIENHGTLGVTLNDISSAFKFTTIGTVDRVLKKFLSLNYITKRYCDRGRSKVFSYIANSYTSVNETDHFEVENMIAPNEPEIKIINNVNLKNEDIPNKTIIDNSVKNVFNKESDLEPLITRSMTHEYCKHVYENSKQTVSFTDRFYYRQQIIFNLLSEENIISLINLKKSIINIEKENQNFIGTLDIKTLIKIVGHLEIMGKLKSVLYQIVYEGKTMNYSFVGNLNVDFTSEDAIAYMNSFMNQFNNKMKTTRANKKWNLVVHNSPAPKVNVAELKLPRFMKMRSLHEYLYYIVYDHPGESLTNTCNETEAIVASYRKDILNGDKAELPKVYYPTIGWKMFVPPLQKYPNYPAGWFFVSDIIHHMPLDLMLKIVNFNKSKVNPEKLSTYATHPVYKYLPLMCLSSDVRITLSQGLKKHIQSILNTLRHLCMIGLLQFGEKKCKDTELIYAYLNKQASLMNTVKSSPSYYRISDMDYEKRTYEFTSDHELETFWLDTWYFCTNTPLGYRVMKLVNIPKRRDMLDRSKIAIEEACSSRSALEAIANDDGTIPGDNKGAAGFDSHLFSHLARNWSIKKISPTTVFPKKRTKISNAIMQRIKKHNHNRKQSEKKKSERAVYQMYSLRCKWTSNEDRVLLFWKLGTLFVKQVKSHVFVSYGLKDVIRSILGKFYRLKSVDNYLRRIRILMRYSSIEGRVNFLLEELKADKEINDLFKSDFEKQHELHRAKKYKAMRDLIISNIKQLIDLLIKRGTIIDTKCIYGKKKTPLEPLEDCNQEASTSNKQPSEENFSKIQYNFCEIIHKLDSVDEGEQTFTKDEIYTSIVLSLIHSSLTNQSVNPRISLTYLQAFKQYPEEILKQAFCTLKDSNLITCSQYHKASLQVLLTTSHIIQSKTYDYGPKFSTILVGSTDTDRYKNAFIAYSDIKEELLEQKILLLSASFGLCTVLTSLCLMNVIDLSIEFDKKFLEYMSDENLEEDSKCLKNTLKRMRSRHFDLLTTCSNDSAEFDRIITSVTKQLKNYQVVCKIKQSIQNFKEEIDKISENIFSRPTFEPQLQYISKLNDLCQKILMFCKKKEQYGATQQDIKVNFDGFSLNILAKSLNDLKKRDLILVAGIKTPTYVHYEYARLWLVKIPSVNWSSVEAAMNEEDALPEQTVSEECEPIQPPTKKMRIEPEIENVDDEKLDFFKARPWTRMDLTVNKKSLEHFLNSVISKIIVKPGIYLKHLIKDYYPILQPLQTRELVEILVDMKCVKMIHVENIQKPTFFSDPSPQNHDLKFSDAIGLESNSVVMLEPTLDCEIRFGYFSNNFRELSKVD